MSGIRTGRLWMLAAALTVCAIGQPLSVAAQTEAGQEQSIEQVIAENARAARAQVLPPFGSNLFSGAFGQTAEDGINPGYEVAPGDKVAVRVWGATSFDDLLTVDHQGNIFIPSVGPVAVGGVRNSDLNARVTESVRTVFTDSVNVYTSLVTAQPVAVFVTGFVNKPGRYAGIPSSSVLYFLDSAGGVDSERGSYRSIQVLRNNRVIADTDLYAFLMEGQLPAIQFQDGDTVFVGSKSDTISVDGEVRNRNRFEMQAGKAYTGADIVRLATPSTFATHVSVIGFRNSERFARYMPLKDFDAFALRNGDRVTFKSDTSEDMIVVEIEGEFEGQSQYVIPKNTRIHELLNYIPVDPQEAEFEAISIKRMSIAKRQKEALEESLNRIESAYYTANSNTNEEAAIRAQESKMISEFIKRAREVEPEGRLVLAKDESIRDVRLEMGDVITIPQRRESVMVNGEVVVSQAILWDEGLSARDYIARSGGYSDQANKKELLLIKQSGEVFRGEDFAVQPGDEIIVLPKVPVKSLQLASTIADILYKVAIAASVAINL
ncbi:polysaccharide biosynthesis/export family protein [Granulosicoccaceae sp. 1_MG-2023]|nr:polysaccharide biosynthesis/export family protein [Granulosicoccaceae sp. 1_MG-2023]